MWRKGNPHALLVGMQTGAATVENSMEVPQKIKNGTAFDPVIPLMGVSLKKLKTLTKKNICTSMFTAVLFTIVKMWWQPTCPSVDDWIRKMWYMYTRECYSDIQKSGISPFATVWMDLEGIMLIEVSQRKTNTM